MIRREIRAQLPAPAERALRETMEEQDRLTARVAGLDEMEQAPSAARYCMMLHVTLPYGLCHEGRFLPSHVAASRRHRAFDRVMLATAREAPHHRTWPSSSSPSGACTSSATTASWTGCSPSTRGRLCWSTLPWSDAFR